MFGVTKSEELKTVLAKMGTKEMGMTFTFNGSDFISCSCGNYAKIKMEEIKERFELENEDFTTIYKCPFCGNTTIIPYVDIEEDNIPILFEPIILRNDDFFWVMSINSVWLYVNINDQQSNLSIEEKENDEWVIVYDKKKKFLFIADMNWDKWWKNYDVLEYRNGYVYDEDGEEVTNILEINEITKYSHYDYNYPHEYFMVKQTKLYDVIKLIADVTNTDMSLIDNFDGGLEDLLKELILYINVKWFKDYETLIEDSSNKNLKIFGINSNDNFVETYFKLIENGVDMKANTFEDAMKIPLNILKNCSTYEEYQDAKKSLSKMKTYALPDIILEWLNNDIPYKFWIGVIKLSEELNTNIETVIKHLHRGKENGFEVSKILNCYFAYIKKGLQDNINLNSSFTSKTYRKWELLTKDKMTKEQYSMIATKPTLDTFVKAMGL